VFLNSIKTIGSGSIIGVYKLKIQIMEYDLNFYKKSDYVEFKEYDKNYKLVIFLKFENYQIDNIIFTHIFYTLHIFY